MADSARHILLMDGPDTTGLIFRVTGVLYHRQLNIIHNDEYVSPSGRFFMRTEFEAGPREAEGTNNEFDGLTLINELQTALADSPDIRFRLVPKAKKSIVVLVTKEHHCLAELLIQFAFGELAANILAVISNYDVLQPLVSKFGVPFHHIPHEHRTREEHEDEILKMLSIYRPEYVVLAKYMRILTAGFVEHFNNRIINIHHSFLPAFIGASPYRQAYERGVKIIGATAHFVNNDLDEGPIIAQNVKAVDHRHTAADMAAEGKDVEKLVLSQALKLVFNDQVFIYGNRTVIL